MKRLVEIDDATHAVVPRVATNEMVDEMYWTRDKAGIDTLAEIFESAIAAAPTHPDAQEVADEDIDSFLAEPFELNYSNYNSDDVEQLQNWAMRAHDIIKALSTLSADAGDDKRDVAELKRLRLFVTGLSVPTHPDRDVWLQFIDAAIAAASKEGEA